MCNAAGCTQNHNQHYCKHCGNQDSDHRAYNCPNKNNFQNNGGKCKVNGCKNAHTVHYCRNCKTLDCDHFSSQCPNSNHKIQWNRIHCKVPGCSERHQQHYCKVCANKDSDHFASNCGTGMVLYHGTKKDWAQNILKTGFSISKQGRIGPGVYFTPSWDDAVKIAARWRKIDKNPALQVSVIQCRVVQDTNNVKSGMHPQWMGVTTGQFKQYVVDEKFLNRIKISKLHNV